MENASTGKQKRKKKQVTFDTVRRFALALPGVEESTSYRSISFRVRGKILARFHQDGESLALKIEYAAREVLMGTHPDTFYVTGHYACYPWVLVRLATVDPDLLRSLMEDAWRGVASKRMVAAYEASRDES